MNHFIPAWHVRRAAWCALLVLALLLPNSAAAQQRRGPQAVFFSQTGHALDNSYGFLDYWRANGQVSRFGYPVTAVIDEGGLPVQYFERARLEYHAASQGTSYAVQIGLLGRELTAGQQFQAGAADAGQVFPATGFTVFGKFLQFWRTWQATSSLGYPISESYAETLPDGSNRAVQWFERGRLEYHPENVPAFFRERRAANNAHSLMLNELMIGTVGREAAQQRGYDLAPVAQPANVPEWSPALWPQRIDVNISTQQLTAYEGDLAVFHAPVSTGRKDFDTVEGTFHVYGKLRYDDMSGRLQGEEYDVRKVPFVMYFNEGYALHGTYWHDLFGTGTRASHGCVNLPLDKAEWLWSWSQPTWSAARASRIAPAEKPKNAAEAELQPDEGLTVFQPGPTVTVHK